jgi:hypothetical protein|tara:strand:- start:5393 stop:5683 length:291 start_codon:yes stop_codon:yes gene_type:complete
LLVAETKALNEKTGKDFDIAASVKAQLPLFACSSAIYDKDVVKDLERYWYCKEFNVPPYPGSFDDQPVDWIERYFIIKKTLIQKEKEINAKARNKN